MISEMIKGFFLVFAAEMGDKSQIIAMTFATQYKKKDVLAGIALAALLNHGLAIALGRYISQLIPLNLLQIISGFLFILFGITALLDEELEDYEGHRSYGPIFTVALAFFISELGDKTQLTAMTLASQSLYPIFILLGTSSAMVATSGIGILVGSKVGDRIPDVLVKIISSIVFLVFGLFKLAESLPERFLTTSNIILFIGIIGAIELFLLNRLTATSRPSAMKEAAEKLYKQTEAIKQSLDDICLGDEVCGSCSGKSCLIGFIRFIIREAREKKDYYRDFNIDINRFIRKNYDRRQVIKSLGLILADYYKFKWVDDDNFVIKKIKDSLEYILFNRTIDELYDLDKYVGEVKKIDREMASLLEAEIQYNLN